MTSWVMVRVTCWPASAAISVHEQLGLLPAMLMASCEEMMPPPPEAVMKAPHTCKDMQANVVILFKLPTRTRGAWPPP